MKRFKLVMMLAGLTGVVLWSNTKAEAASGCCRYDCNSAYCTMTSSGVPLGDAEAWRTQCLNDCDAHGTADPSYCPVIFNCRDL
jgi:hypothetical protein